MSKATNLGGDGFVKCLDFPFNPFQSASIEK